MLLSLSFTEEVGAQELRERNRPPRSFGLRLLVHQAAVRHLKRPPHMGGREVLVDV